jgi:DNA polymerase gamma 1
MQSLREAESTDPATDLRFIRAQISNDEAEFREILKETRKPPPPPSPSPVKKATTATTLKTSSTTVKKPASTAVKKPILPYYASPRLMPAQAAGHQRSVTEALRATPGRFKPGGGGFEKGKWDWKTSSYAVGGGARVK